MSNTADVRSIATEDKDQGWVLSKARAMPLPSHHPNDCALYVLPSTTLLRMQDYISDSFQSEILRLGI